MSTAYRDGSWDNINLSQRNNMQTDKFRTSRHISARPCQVKVKQSSRICHRYVREMDVPGLCHKKTEKSVEHLGRVASCDTDDIPDNVVPISSLYAPKPIVNRAADPIRDDSVLREIQEYLLSHGKYGYRNWLIFVVGIHIGRRGGDLLKLRLIDVYDFERGCVRDRVTHIEQKTKKQITFYLADTVKRAILQYLDNRPSISMYDFLFPSQKGGHLTGTAYYNILLRMRKELDLQFNLSTHSMRKTWAYRLYQAHKGEIFEGGYDIVDHLQFMFGHSTRLMTLRYIGITDEITERLYKDTSFECISLSDHRDTGKV